MSSCWVKGRIMEKEEAKEVKPGYYWIQCIQNHTPGSKNRCYCNQKPEIGLFKTNLEDKHGSISDKWECIGSSSWYEESNFKVLSEIPEFKEETK